MIKWEREERMAQRAMAISSAMIEEGRLGIPSGRTKVNLSSPSKKRERKSRLVK